MANRKIHHPYNCNLNNYQRPNKNGNNTAGGGSGVVGGLRPVWFATVGGAALILNRDYVSGSGQSKAVRFFVRPPGSA